MVRLTNEFTKPVGKENIFRTDMYINGKIRYLYLLIYDDFEWVGNNICIHCQKELLLEVYNRTLNRNDTETWNSELRACCHCGCVSEKDAFYLLCEPKVRPKYNFEFRVKNRVFALKGKKKNGVCICLECKIRAISELVHKFKLHDLHKAETVKTKKIVNKKIKSENFEIQYVKIKNILAERNKTISQLESIIGGLEKEIAKLNKKLNPPGLSITGRGRNLHFRKKDFEVSVTYDDGYNEDYDENDIEYDEDDCDEDCEHCIEHCNRRNG